MKLFKIFSFFFLIHDNSRHVIFVLNGNVVIDFGGVDYQFITNYHKITFIFEVTIIMHKIIFSV
jgi:hypothetical protein